MAMASSRTNDSNVSNSTDMVSTPPQRSFLRPALSGTGFGSAVFASLAPPSPSARLSNNHFNSSSGASSSSTTFLRPSVLTAAAELLRRDKALQSSEEICETDAVPDSASTSSANHTNDAESSSGASALSNNAHTIIGGHNAASSARFATDSQSSAPAVMVGEDFVFGRNISSRVTTASTSTNKDAEDERKPADSSSDSDVFANCPSSASAAENGDEDKAVSSSTEGDSSSTTAFEHLAASAASGSICAASVDEGCSALVESAQRYQEHISCQQRPELESVEVLTGEEGESNVLHLRAKAYYLVAEEKRWAERGRGFLRLNDLPSLPSDDESSTLYRSRLIFRQTGALKVLFNTFVWRDMSCEAVTDKSVRLSAQEMSGKVAFYLLVLQTSNDANQLCQAVNYRLQQLQSGSKSKSQCVTAAQLVEEEPDKAAPQSSHKRRYSPAVNASKEEPTCSSTSSSCTTVYDKRPRRSLDDQCHDSSDSGEEHCL